MAKCQNCGKQIPYKFTLSDGKEILCSHRKYCLDCSPPGKRNFWGGKKVEKTEDGKRFTYEKKFVCNECGKKYTHKTRNLVCSNCRNSKKRRGNKLKSIDLLGKKCNICGYDKCVDALDFHHKDPKNKKFNLSTSWQKNWNILESELKKCILLCKNCHAELHSLKSE